MGNHQPTFMRRFQVFAPFKTGRKKIFEPVTITVGFNGPVDADSGMIINMAEVDAWIDVFKAAMAKKSYSSQWAFCKISKANLKTIVKTTEISHLEFSFRELFVRYVAGESYLGWSVDGLIQADGKTWLSHAISYEILEETTSRPNAKRLHVKSAKYGYPHRERKRNKHRQH